MARIVVLNHVSLDGVMQSPARPDEDTRGGFQRGGWAASDTDEVMMSKIGPHMGSISDGALLLGRRTYEDFFDVWHGRTDNPFSAALEAATKYVVSTTLSEPLEWQNSRVLRDIDDVKRIKRETEGDLLVMGSGALTRTLLAEDSVDQLIIVIHPVLIGSGTRLFADEGRFAELRLIDSSTTPKGVLIVSYERR